MRNAASLAGTGMDSVNGAVSDDPTAVRGAFLEDSDCALIMKFDTLTPVPGPYVSSANVVRGIAGGGLPWVVEAGSGSLSRDDHLLVRVRGLVLASDPLGLVFCRGSPMLSAIHTTWFTVSPRPPACGPA